LPLTKELLRDKRFKKIAAFQVDYNEHKEFLYKYRAPWRTTLIVFKNQKEIGRSVGDLDQDAIRALFEKGL
jgi:hypothetical protein